MGNENTVFTSTVHNSIDNSFYDSTSQLAATFFLQKLFIDARDGRLESVRKGLKAAADFDLNEQDKEVSQ